MFLAPEKNNKSFTLIELLVVLALVAILSVVVVVTLNPAELIKQARDSNRLSDLSTINTALNLFSADVTGGFMGTSTNIYVSIPSTLSDCSNLGLPTLPSTYTYSCVAAQNLRNTNGTGWIPVNFQRISSNSPISQLPIDPTNTTSTGNYYIYVTGGSWELSSNLESIKQKSVTGASGTDGGVSLSSYEIGNNLRLIPSGLLEWKRDSSLVGYWTFDEGVGSAAKDYSGYANDGTVVGTPTWTSGKLGSSMDFNGAASYVNVPDSNSLDISNTLTISAWVKYISTPAGAGQTYIIQKWSGVADANYAWYWYTADTYNPNGNNILANMGGTWGGMSTWMNMPSDGIWHHFVQTYNSIGDSVTYFDGVISFQWTPSAGALATNSSPVLIGQLSGGYRAIIDDFRIYNRVLSAAEISALYNSTR